MKKKMLEDILHILHTIYESLEEIVIAMAKSVGMTEKKRPGIGLKRPPIDLMKMRSIVFSSFVVASVIVVGVNGVDMTSLHDQGPQEIKEQAQPPGTNACSNCNGTGKIKVPWTDEVWIPPKYPSYEGHYETRTDYNITECPICKGKGYLSA